MPRPSWKGVLRLSLVTCPVYLLPATVRTKAIRLNQVWVPRTEPSEPDYEEEVEEAPRPSSRRVTRQMEPPVETAPPVVPERIAPATRISLRPHDPYTGAEVEREEVVKGYEYDRGQFVTFSPDEMKGLDIESTGAIDLATFVPRAEVDPLYFNVPYYVYPDGWIATEAFQVLREAMTEAGLAGVGRITLSRRERMALVEPRENGMVLITLRANEEVRPASFAAPDTEIDPEMVAVATTIIKRRLGHFDPTTFRDRYQDALREMIQAKLKGLPLRTQPARAPAPVIDLMSALKRSLVQETAPAGPKPRPRATKDRRQTNLLLPVSGKAQREARTSIAPIPRPRRKKA